MIKGERKLRSLLKENDTIIIGFSGGPDSMYLLNLLKKISKTLPLKIIASYVNHKARKDYKKEETFVLNYCQSNNIILETYTINEYQKGRFTEEEARNIRLNFFLQCQKKYNASYIMSAHHGDDLIETIIMKIIRGSTLDSISGIKMITKYDTYTFVRPLLNLSKKEILTYLKEENIPYIIDETNELEEHLRNRIRKNILPVLKKENQNVHEKFLKFSMELEEANSYIKRQLEKIKLDIKCEDKTDLKKFQQLDSFLQKEYLKSELKSIYKEQITKINSETINNLNKFLNKENSKNKFILPLEVNLYLNKGKFFFQKKQKVKPYCIECTDMVMLPNSMVLKRVNEYTEKSNFEIHLNSNDIKWPLFITSRKPKMRMDVKNLNGSKKVKDIFIDCKIPEAMKDEIPIMVDSDNKVLWILGIKKSKYDLNKNEKYDIIYRYTKEGNEK